MRFFYGHSTNWNSMTWKKTHENKFPFFFQIKLYRVVALTSFSYLQTLPGTPSMPHEFLNESISRILFISALCTAIILLLWLHPLCHLPPCVPFTGQHQIFIASLFFNKLSTRVSAISTSPSLLHSGHFHSQVKRDRLRDSLF